MESVPLSQQFTERHQRSSLDFLREFFFAQSRANVDRVGQIAPVLSRKWHFLVEHHEPNGFGHIDTPGTRGRRGRLTGRPW